MLRIPHPDNFSFAESRQGETLRLGKRRLTTRVVDHGGGVFRVEVDGPGEPPALNDAVLTPPLGAKGQGKLWFNAQGALQLEDSKGVSRLAGRADGCFGVSGSAWMLRFEATARDRYYGLGEKWGDLEKSGLRTCFWNSDVAADFSGHVVREGGADPLYASVPYLIIKRGASFVGVLLDNPGETFICLNADFAIGGRSAEGNDLRAGLYLGALNGRPRIYFILGPGLPELTRKLQPLVGTTPRPPLWALGHHQSRWGYESESDLEALDRRFAEHRIPCDGLWLDIDYMQDFKVFSLNPQRLPQPENCLSELGARGRNVVPILEPGIKREPGYPIYEAALKGKHLCLNREAEPFVGFVWPGKTVFPDFSQAHTKAWWAEQVAGLMLRGFAGFWLDMNDPAVGRVRLDDMRFSQGALDHASYHNQYALGMAQATRSGCLAARPNERPFLLTRSAYTSISRYSAVWTGDNCSNERHLQLAITTSLNLALSGVPFNGPDVGGFDGDCTEDLLLRWYKAGFLFPFLRNHSCRGTRAQEPWAFSRRATRQIAHWVRLRYKLLPYLYSLFITQERIGEAIMRPLFHDFRDTPALSFERINDQFLLGPALMQAPFVDRSGQRPVSLPHGGWYAAHQGRFVAGGRVLQEREEANSTPLYVREGSVLPMLPGTRYDNRSDLSDIELHVFLRRGGKTKGSPQKARLEYVFDDGHSLEYQRGVASRLVLFFEIVRGALLVRVAEADLAFAPARLRLVLYDRFREVVFSSKGGTERLSLAEYRWRFAGKPLATWRTRAVALS